MQLVQRVVILCGLLVALLGLGQAAAQPPATTVYLPLLRTRLAQTGDSSNLNVLMATHLGGPQADSATAVDVAPNGTIVLAGVLPEYAPGSTSTVLLNGTSGAVVRVADTGRTILSVTRIGTVVNDLEISPGGMIVVCGDFGVAALNATADSLLWHAAPGVGRRCAVGVDGTTAVLVGGVAYAYDAAGAPLGSWPVAGSAQNDIAVDGQQQLVIVTGYNQVSGNLQLPFLRGHSYSGELRWRSYDVPAAPSNLQADTRGERVAIGRDGKLYFTGWINGGTGASIFVRDPQDINRSATDRIVVTDSYTNPFNVDKISMLWFGRFNPADGSLELAQSVLTRRANGSGNSISGLAIMADADGTVYIAGTAFAALANRAQVTIGGVGIGAYSSEGGAADAYVLVVSPDFRQRKHWVAFAGPTGGRGSARGVSVRNGTVALAATLNSGAFVVQNALQPVPGGATDMYLAVWE